MIYILNGIDAQFVYHEKISMRRKIASNTLPRMQSKVARHIAKNCYDSLKAVYIVHMYSNIHLDVACTMYNILRSKFMYMLNCEAAKQN